MFKLIALVLFIQSGIHSPPSSNSDPKPQGGNEKRVILGETIVVTAARKEEPILDSISFVSILDRQDLLLRPPLVLDDHLRRIPGFSLFRRSNSISSHPTTQGISLRGIGPSGTSRSLILLDGIPLNDPFGGWVYWNRIPTISLSQVEVSRGATSQLYGSSAMGGTVQLRTLPIEDRRFHFLGQMGNRNTYDFSGFSTDVIGDWGYLLSGRIFETEGFFIVPEKERGTVDTPADVKFQSFFGKVKFKNGFAGVNFFREKRSNGTKIQRNDSWLAMVNGGVTGTNWKLNFFSQFQELNSSFSRVLTGRSQEFKTSQQHFPSSGLGSSFSWQPTETTLVGVDWRQSRWDGRAQNFSGVFGQYLKPVHPRLDILLGGRFDIWQNHVNQTSLNPRAGLLFRASKILTFRTSIYRGFRAPTLNELYRPYQIGNIVTQANKELLEERLWGTEGGLEFHPHPNILIRLNGFWNTLKDPVSNVTLTVEPNLIVRQRQNLGSGTIKGGEALLRQRLTSRWSVMISYLYSQAVVDNSGLLFPQVPRHQGVATLEYLGPLQIVLEGRFMSRQYEDDLNQLPLAGGGLLDFQIQKPFTDQLELFVGIENLFNRQHPVGRLPIVRVGTPLMVHGGIRLRIGH